MAELDDLRRDAESDQTAVTLAMVARFVRTYYGELIEAGVPADLAAKLTRDWQWLAVHHSQYPDQAPRVVLSE